jgi:hypothetical protein
MQSDPVVLTTARNAVVTEPQILGLLEIGGGIDAARATDAVSVSAVRPFWYSPVFWITMILVVPPIYYMVAVVIWRMPDPSEQLVTQVITGLLGLMMVAAAFYYGTTIGSSRKTDIIANQQAQK